MSEQIVLLQKLKNAISKFFSYVIKNFPNNEAPPEVKIMQKFLDNNMPLEEIMGLFISKLLIEKKYIEQRYDGFFTNYDDLSSKGYDENNKFITHVYKLFKNIYLSDKLDDKFKMSCWKWFDLFIKISETYYIQFGEVKGFEVDHLHPVFIEIDKKRSEYKHSH